MYKCTFLNECYLCFSQGLLGKREFLPQTECLRRLIVPICNHQAFARLCRSVFLSLSGCNLKNIDIVCITLISYPESLSFCSQNLPSILWCESWISISQHHIAGRNPHYQTAISAGCPIAGRGPLPHSSEERLAPSLQSTAAQSPPKLCSLPSARPHLGHVSWFILCLLVSLEIFSMLAHHGIRNKIPTCCMSPGTLCNRERNTHIPLRPPPLSLGSSGMCSETEDTSGYLGESWQTLGVKTYSGTSCYVQL